MTAQMDILGSLRILNIRYLPLAAAMAAILITPIAQAQDQTQDQTQQDRPQGVSAAALADGRCMAAMMNLSERSKDTNKEVLGSGVMFFLGKIVGRGGAKAVVPAFDAGAAMVNDSNAPEIAKECTKESAAIFAAL